MTTTTPVQRYNHRLRHEVFTHYSNGKPYCACCGVDHLEFLTIDHVNNDGAAHRKEIGAHTGKLMYLWLKKNGFPPGFQVLCFNCNCSKGLFGYCPHKEPSRIQPIPTIKERTAQKILTASTTLVASGEYPSVRRINTAIDRNAPAMVIAHRKTLIAKGLWPTKVRAESNKKGKKQRRSTLKPSAKEIATAKEALRGSSETDAYCPQTRSTRRREG